MQHFRLPEMPVIDQARRKRKKLIDSHTNDAGNKLTTVQCNKHTRPKT